MVRSAISRQLPALGSSRVGLVCRELPCGGHALPAQPPSNGRGRAWYKHPVILARWERSLMINFFFRILLYFLKFIYFERQRERERERERESKQGRGTERGRERKNPKQAPHCLSAQSMMWGLNSRTVRSWPELKSRVGHLTNCANQVPWTRTFIISFHTGYKNTECWASSPQSLIWFFWGVPENLHF